MARGPRGLGRRPQVGGVRHYTFSAPDKRRPVVVISREEAVPLFSTVMVAPVTSRIRRLLSEVVIGAEEGLQDAVAVVPLPPAP